MTKTMNPKTHSLLHPPTPSKHPNTISPRNPIPRLLPTPPLLPLFFLQLFLSNIFSSSSQTTCPSCGSMQIPYPLSTSPDCGDPNYSLRCNTTDSKLFFDALNGSSYRVLTIQPSAQRLVVQPSPWISGECVTEDMPRSEGLRLNQSLPFNVTASNTIFLYNCSPRLLISPLNCTPSSLCHRYLEGSGRVEPRRAELCASGEAPCCTFVAGGLPSAYKIRLHSSGCRAFRSILHLDLSKPPSRWEEGLEIRWASPPEPVCGTQLDCTKASTCSPTKNGLRRCLCNSGYRWDHAHATCFRKDPTAPSRARPASRSKSQSDSSPSSCPLWPPPPPYGNPGNSPPQRASRKREKTCSRPARGENPRGRSGSGS